MEIRINEIKGIDEFLRKIGELSVQKVINGSIKKSIFTVTNESRREAPMEIGELKKGFKNEFTNLEGRMWNYQKYAEFVHEGTGIFARGGNGRKTPWVYKAINGKYYKTRGQKANPFMERAFKNTEGKLEQIFRDDISNFLTDLTK